MALVLKSDPVMRIECDECNKEIKGDHLQHNDSDEYAIICLDCYNHIDYERDKFETEVGAMAKTITELEYKIRELEAKISAYDHAVILLAEMSMQAQKE